MRYPSAAASKSAPLPPRPVQAGSTSDRKGPRRSRGTPSNSSWSPLDADEPTTHSGSEDPATPTTPKSAPTSVGESNFFPHVSQQQTPVFNALVASFQCEISATPDTRLKCRPSDESESSSLPDSSSSLGTGSIKSIASGSTISSTSLIDDDTYAKWLISASHYSSASAIAASGETSTKATGPATLRETGKKASGSSLASSVLEHEKSSDAGKHLHDGSASSQVHEVDGCMVGFRKWLARSSCLRGIGGSPPLVSSATGPSPESENTNKARRHHSTDDVHEESATETANEDLKTLPDSVRSLILSRVDSDAVTVSLAAPCSRSSGGKFLHGMRPEEFQASVVKVLLQIRDCEAESEIRALLFGLFFMVKNNEMGGSILEAFSEVSGCEILLKVSEGQPWQIRVFCGLIFTLLLLSTVEDDFLSMCTKETLWRIYKLQRSCVVEFDHALLQNEGLAYKGVHRIYQSMTMFIYHSAEKRCKWMTTELAKESVKKLTSKKWRAHRELQCSCYNFLLAALSQGQKRVARIMVKAGVVQRMLRHVEVDNYGQLSSHGQMLTTLLRLLCSLSTSTRKQVMAWYQDALQDQARQIAARLTIRACLEGTDPRDMFS